MMKTTKLPRRLPAMYCPSCRGEYREGFDWCSDCEVALVEALPEEPEESELQEEAGEEETEEPESPAAPSDREARDFRALELGMVLVVAFLTPLASSIWRWWNNAPVPKSNGSFTELLFYFTGDLGPLLVLVYVLYRQGRSLKDIGLTVRGSDLPLGLALCIASFLPLLVRSLATGEDPAGWASQLAFSAISPLLLLTFLVAATFEELIARAYMITAVSELTGSAFLAIASSVCLQALYHIHYGGRAAVTSAGTFLIYSLFYWKTRRITPVILGHFGHNVLISMFQ